MARRWHDIFGLGSYSWIAVIIENSHMGRRIAALIKFKIFRTSYTLLIVLVGWVFFRSDSCATAVHIITSFFVFETGGMSAGLDLHTLQKIGVAIISFLLLESINFRKSFLRLVIKRYAIVLNSLFLFIVTIGNFVDGSFIYFQF